MEFSEITNTNIWKVCMLEVEENQKNFVAENLQSLAEAYATRNEGHNAFPLEHNRINTIGPVFLIYFSIFQLLAFCGQLKVFMLSYIYDKTLN